MDNQQVPETDLAWLAGIWDGEGTFSAGRVRPSKNGLTNFSVLISMGNTGTKLLERVFDILTRLDIRYGIYEKRSKNPNARQCWQLQVTGAQNQLRFIQALLPHLTEKRFQAERLAEYVARRLARGKLGGRGVKTSGYTREELQLLIDIYVANGDVHGASETVRAEMLKRGI